MFASAALKFIYTQAHNNPDDNTLWTTGKKKKSLNFTMYYTLMHTVNMAWCYDTTRNVCNWRLKHSKIAAQRLVSICLFKAQNKLFAGFRQGCTTLAALRPLSTLQGQCTSWSLNGQNDMVCNLLTMQKATTWANKWELSVFLQFVIAAMLKYVALKYIHLNINKVLSLQMVTQLQMHSSFHPIYGSCASTE